MFTSKPPEKILCDVLVIGSGPGGAVSSATLKKAGFDVLLVEEGLSGFNPSDSTSAEVQKIWRSNGLTAAIGKTPISYAEGCAVGGGSEINSAIIQRAPDTLVNHWSHKYAIENFNSSSLAKYYDEAFKVVGATYVDKSDAVSEIIKDGARKMSWTLSHLERSDDSAGKRSMSATLIKDAVKDGMRILTGVKISKINFKGSVAYQAEGLHLKADGSKRKILISFNSVIISCGAIQSPALLQRSGIKHNIGNSLMMHPTLKALALYPDAINARQEVLSPYAITQFMPDIRFGCSVFKAGFFGMSLAEDWDIRSPLIKMVDQSLIMYSMIRASGRGKVIVVPGFIDPLVTYTFTQSDWGLMTRGISLLGKFLLSTGAERVLPSITGHEGWCNESQLDSDHPFLLENLPKKSNPFTIHLFSSCPMGENKNLSAVDSYGRVHETRNVYISDASIIPEAPGVNPQATIMAISKRNIERFIELRA